MGKRKTTSQDFLKLLDDQESASDSVAFAPKAKAGPEKVAAARQTKSKGTSRLRIGKRQITLSPVQEELLLLFLNRTPIISRIVRLAPVQKFVKRIVDIK